MPLRAKEIMNRFTKEARSSKLEARRCLLVPATVGLILCCGREAAAQMNPPQNRFSTHDWTLPTFGGGGEAIIGVNDFREFWADVKTPGDGVAYSVGTIEVRSTLAGALFSGSQAEPPPGLAPFAIPGATTPARQVVMLQQASPANAGITIQRYYYGTNQDGALRATHGRGVSVWPAATAADTRIAICGESQDESLPQANVPAWPGVGGGGTAGFVAMFDGNGDLLWSHHFFGTAAGGHCAITDVSVRVATVGGVVTDFVTFCGVSTYGMPAANATLTAVQPFAAPVAPFPCANSAGGATNNGAGQWDGIVGRLVRVHNGTGPAATEFLSSVGGTQQDGLFGIAEIDAERFAVVGSTGANAPAPAGADFPVTLGACPSSAVAPFSAGVVAVFRAVTGSPLSLEMSHTIGELAAGTNTVARDVVVQRQWGAAGEPGLILVGSTNDGNVFSSASLTITPVVFPQGAIGGGNDGILLAGFYVPPTGPGFTGVAVWSAATFRGGEGNEGLSGVQAWNEYYDQVSVTGTTSTVDIDVANYFLAPAFTTPTPPLPPRWVLMTGGAVAPALGGAPIGGSATDVPTAVAVPVNGPPMMNATTIGAFAEYTLGNPAGGGISVDAQGRTHVVGTTASANFPFPGGRPKTGVTHDAVRIALDMVPVGIGRTDGTRTTVIPPGMPPYPLPGLFGGTTPECALTPFGHQIGLSDPQTAPALPRMWIDWDGPAPAQGVTGAVVVTRPPNSSLLLGAALQFNFPTAPLPLLPDGILLWTTDPSALIFTVPPTGFAPLSFPLNPLPQGPLTVAAQLLCLLGAPVTGGSLGPTCPGGGQSTFAASSAMWISW